MLCFVRLNAQNAARAPSPLAVTRSRRRRCRRCRRQLAYQTQKDKKNKKNFVPPELAFASVFFFARRLLRLISGAFGGNTRCSRVANCARARRQRGA